MPIPIIFLHGLLGAQDDWAGVVAELQHFPQFAPITLDLPRHGENHAVPCASFEHARLFLQNALPRLTQNQPFWLVGYSLGGRLALDYFLNTRPNHLLGVILEGANIGLPTEAERLLRAQSDEKWAKRFRTEPLEKVLNDWYRQPVFADLSDTERSHLVKKRASNHGGHIAEMLTATSLAKQPFWLEPVRHATNCHFLIGERDQKFRTMATQYALSHQLIPNAGHNAHREAPVAFCQALLRFISHA